MSELVRTERNGDVLVITIDNPPVNALGPGVPEGLAASVQQAANDAEVNAVVVICAGRTFIAGADIRMFARIVTGEYKLNLNELLAVVENSPKPVIMAIHGTAFGGGLETAMAGHYRIAAASAQMGQPEVKLGLIPGAGGTQRLPRLIGVEKAMEMCAFGEPISASTALDWGLIDQIASGDLLESALAFAATCPPARRTRDQQAKLLDAAQADSLAALFMQQCAKRMRGQVAPPKAVECIAATATLAFDAGIDNEKHAFAELLAGTQSKAMIHAFFAPRSAAKLPYTEAALPVKRAAVVGAGTMGGGIAMCFANAGIPVVLKDVSQDALERGVANIRRNYETSVKKGKLSEAEMNRRLELLAPTTSYESIADADIVIEAVFEDLELKKSVFAEIDAAARPGAILASNTSTLNVDEIAASTKRPEAVIGTHFFSPANVMKLLEVVRGKASAPEAIVTGMDLAKRLGKVGVLSGNCYGFIGNRMFGPYRSQAVALVEEGASPYEIDRILYEWGMAMGPMAVADLAGLDVSYLVRREAQRLGLAHGEGRNVEDLLYEQGRYGQKSFMGWYKYDANRRPSEDPEVITMVRAFAASQGIPQRNPSAEEIRGRILCALINEGARLLEEGIAQRASDIDVVYLNGYGFPAWRGGPMHYAETVGLAQVLETIQGYYEEFGPFWKPADLLVKAAAHGKWE